MTPLQDDQIMYGLRDAYSGALIYRKLLDAETSEHIPSHAVLTKGTRVRLVNGCGVGLGDK